MRKQIMLKVMATALAAVVAAPIGSLTINTTRPVIVKAATAKAAKAAAELLKEQGISAAVVDMYCIKPLDTAAIVKAASNAKAVLTVEEHAPFGGLGSMVSQVVGSECPCKVVNMSLPDAPVITGTSREVFDYYGLNAEGIAKKAAELVK